MQIYSSLDYLFNHKKCPVNFGTAKIPFDLPPPLPNGHFGALFRQAQTFCILQNSAKYHMIHFQLWSAWWCKYIHPWITFLIIKNALSISALPKYLSTSRPLCQTGTLGNFFARRRPFDKGALIRPGQRLHPPPKWVLPKYTEHFYWLMSKSDRWWRWQVRFPSNSSDARWLPHYK